MVGKEKRTKSYILTGVGVIIALYVLFPFFLVVLNSFKAQASIVESQWPPFQIDGKQYGVPWSMDGKAFFYNKEIFSKLGLEVPTTLTELYAVCDAL